MRQAAAAAVRMAQGSTPAARPCALHPCEHPCTQAHNPSTPSTTQVLTAPLPSRHGLPMTTMAPHLVSRNSGPAGIPQVGPSAYLQQWLFDKGTPGEASFGLQRPAGVHTVQLPIGGTAGQLQGPLHPQLQRPGLMALQQQQQQHLHTLPGTLAR